MSEVRLIAVGDISLATKNGAYPFGPMSSVLATKDILFGNLETVLTRRGEAAQKSVLLTVPPNAAGHLAHAGFDVVNLANNHILDMGATGFHDTLDTLEKSGIKYIGVARDGHGPSAAVIERNGLRIGFLGYCEHGATDRRTGITIGGINPERVRNNIIDLKSRCDSVVISLHWGMENVHYPAPRQIALARSLVDSGADLILGHHPHVLQGIERYGRGLIAYSLGNFQFGIEDFIPDTACAARESVILAANLTCGGIVSYGLHPVEIDDNLIPTPALPKRARAIARFVDMISGPVTAGAITSQRWVGEVAPAYIADSIRSWKLRVRKYGFIHLVLWIQWLLSPFVLRCYATMALHKLSGRPSSPKPMSQAADYRIDQRQLSRVV
jgi:poly-gamma-glutamate synthesis protein (capsule biosynthesis protein)